jgi:hypothetical protein
MAFFLFGGNRDHRAYAKQGNNCKAEFLHSHLSLSIQKVSKLRETTLCRGTQGTAGQGGTRVQEQLLTS